MKKATFLFWIVGILFILPYGSVEADSFPFSGYTITLEDHMVDGHQGILVTKGGMDPFETVISMESYDMHYNDVVSFQDGFIVYGYTSGGVNPRDYSGFFVWLDEDGEILMDLEEPLDYGFQEDVRNIYNLNGSLVVEVQQTRFDGYELKVLNHVYLLFDQPNNLLREHIVEGQVKYVRIDGTRLLGSFSEADVFDFAFEASGDLRSKEDSLGIEDKGVYQGEVCLSLFNDAYLNGELLRGDTCIDAVGHHLLRVNDRTYTFIIEPTIQGVEEKVYYESVIISFPSGYATLNGDAYTSNEEIVDIGHYQFVLHGVNGYQKKVDFEIGAVVEGITNNTVYKNPVTISFTGQGYINNQYIESPITIESEGEYILKIKGEDGYLETYYFEIQKEVEKTSFIDFVQKVDVFVLGTLVVVGIVLIKRKK